MDIVRWMRKRWMAIRQERSFDALEGWAIKEISHGLFFIILVLGGF